MPRKRIDPSALSHSTQNAFNRMSRVWREEGPLVFVRKLADKILQTITGQRSDPTEAAFAIEEILKNPMFDYSNLEAAARIQFDPTVSIVIPVYNGINFVPDCVGSFFQAPTSIRFEVILIDNVSTDGTREALRELTRLHPNLHLIENEVNAGFAGAINQGAAQARGEFLAICNSDIIVTPGWLDRLVASMQADPTLAVVSPMTNYVGEGPQLDQEAIEVTPETANLYAQKVAARSGTHYVPSRLVFFCVLLRKHYFDLLGGIAGVYGLGNYEDDDYCLRARLSGYRLGVVPGSFVFHYGSRTFKEQKIDHTQWMLKNEQIYTDRMVKFAIQHPLQTKALSSRSNTPVVSVIIRTKDRTHPLRRALNSLANQVYKDFEVVVVNDGGADIGETLKTYEPFLRIRYVPLTKSTGRPGALNAGLDAASGEWITYLDDDDILYPTHLEALMHAAINVNQKCVVYTQANKALCLSDESQKNLVTVTRERFAAKKFSIDEMLIDNWIPIMSFMHPAEAVQEIGRFDLSFDIFEDWDFLLRLAEKYPFEEVSERTCEYRFRFGAQVDDSTLLMRERAIQFRTKIYERYPAGNEEIQKKRSLTIFASRQQIEDVKRIGSLALPSYQKSLLTAARLGGFTLPEQFRPH